MTASKRIFCFIVCSVLMMGTIFTVSAEESTDALTYGSFTYEVVDGGVCITGYTGEGGDVAVPSQIDGKTVKALGDEVFWYRDDITAVNLPSNLEYIGNRVFQGCAQLTAVVLPDSVSEIGDACFESCESLVSLNIPASLVYVGAFAYDSTPWLTQFDGNSSIILGGRIFYKYVADEDMVVLPEGIVCISGNAFQSKKLSHVTIPDTVAFIGDYCFVDCPNLKGVVIPDDIYYLGVASLGVLSGKDGFTNVEGFTVYADCKLGEDYAAENGVQVKPVKDYSMPENLPDAEQCEIKSDINTGQIVKKTSSGLNDGAVAAIVITVVSCVVIIGGIAAASFVYEKKRKQKIKEDNKNHKKKK